MIGKLHFALWKKVVPVGRLVCLISQDTLHAASIHFQKLKTRASILLSKKKTNPKADREKLSSSHQSRQMFCGGEKPLYNLFASAISPHLWSKTARQRKMEY